MIARLTPTAGRMIGGRVPQYVIVNLRERVIEVHEHAVAEAARYDRSTVRRAGEMVAFRTSSGGVLNVESSRILP